MKSLQVTLGKRLRVLRHQNDLTQKEMAEILGLQTQQAYSNFENGKTKFSSDFLNRIKKCFDVDITADSSENRITLQSELRGANREFDLFRAVLELTYRKLLLEKELKLIENEIKTLTIPSI